MPMGLTGPVGYTDLGLLTVPLRLGLVNVHERRVGRVADVSVDLMSRDALNMRHRLALGQW